MDPVILNPTWKAAAHIMGAAIETNMKDKQLVSSIVPELRRMGNMCDGLNEALAIIRESMGALELSCQSGAHDDEKWTQAHALRIRATALLARQWKV